MFVADSDVNSWKEDLRGRDVQRRNAQEELQNMKFSKPVTWRDVKQKDLEFHPILQKFADGEKVNFLFPLFLTLSGKRKQSKRN